MSKIIYAVNSKEKTCLVLNIREHALSSDLQIVSQYFIIKPSGTSSSESSEYEIKVWQPGNKNPLCTLTGNLCDCFSLAFQTKLTPSRPTIKIMEEVMTGKETWLEQKAAEHRSEFAELKNKPGFYIGQLFENWACAALDPADRSFFLSDESRSFLSAPLSEDEDSTNTVNTDTSDENFLDLTEDKRTEDSDSEVMDKSANLYGRSTIKNGMFATRKPHTDDETKESDSYSEESDAFSTGEL